jgi:TPR repeat protein
LLEAAANGDPEAQYAVGWYYERGKSVHVNLNEAEKWWLKSATAGNPKAQSGLGQLAFNRNDLTEAEKWWRKSAEAGNTNAQCGLGHLTYKRKDLAEAEQWWRKSAEAGNTTAQITLGTRAYKRKDMNQAVSWWLKAASSGDVRAQHNLGFYGYRILGEAKAMEWIKKAAENGYWQSQNFLGMTYLWGKTGILERNRVLALAWTTLGIEAQPHPPLRTRICFLILKLSTPRKQIAEAARYIENWKDARSKCVPTPADS